MSDHRDRNEVERELHRAAEGELEQLHKEGEALCSPELMAASRSGIEALLQERSPAPSPTERPLWKLLVPAVAAIAAVIVAMVWLRDEAPVENTPEPLPLGATKMELLEPVGPIAEWELFRWLGDPPKNGRYELRVYPKDDAGGTPLFERELDDSFWIPTNEERERLGESVRWEIRILDAFGNPLDTLEGEAWLDGSSEPSAPAPEPKGNENARLPEPSETSEEEEILADQAVDEAYALHDGGDAQAAIELLEQVEAELTNALAGRPRIQTVLASLLLPLGRFDEALAWLDRADESVARLPLESSIVDALKLGILKTRIDTCIGLGLVDRLFDMVQEEEELAAKLGPDLFRIAAKLHAIDIDLLTQRNERAARRCEAELEAPIWNRFTREKSLLRLRHGVANWFLSRDDLARLEVAQRSIRTFLENPAAPEPTKLQAFARLAELHLVQGDLKAAKAALDSAHELFARYPPSEVALVDGPHIAALAAELALASGDPETNWAELRDELNDNFATFLRRWRSTPIRPGGIGFLQYPRRRMVLNTLVHLETLAHPGDAGHRRAAQLLFRIQSLGTFAREYEQENGSLGQIDDALEFLAREDGVVLCYSPGRHRTSVLLFTQDESKYAVLPPEHDYEKARRSLQAAITSRSPLSKDSLSKHAQAVARALLPAEFHPAIERARHLTVVGLDLLGYVPFELLPLESGETIEDVTAVSYLPSLPVANVLVSRRERAVSFERDLGVFLSPAYSDDVRASWPELHAIPRTDEDRSTLRAGLDPNRAIVIEGAAASLRTLGRVATNFRTLHIVTHGVLCHERERPSCLLFAPSGDREDGPIGAREVERLRMPPLVRVSACGATYAHERRGDDGLASLSGAFLRSGSDVVIMSPHRLDYNVVKAMTPTFHSALFRSEHSPAEAMRRARLAVRDERDVVKGLVHTFGLGGAPLR